MTQMYSVEFRFHNGNESVSKIEAINHLRAINIFSQTECDTRTGSRKIDVSSIVVDRKVQLFPCTDGCFNMLFPTPWKAIRHIQASHPCECPQNEGHAGACGRFSGESNIECNCH